MWIDREFFRGFVKLYALWRGSKPGAYGMGILKEMRELGFELSPGTLYPALEKLETEGDIVWRKEVVEGRVRKSYRLTARGKRELEEITSRLRTMVRLVFSDDRAPHSAGRKANKRSVILGEQ
jgi:PadR family transcriptional regulator, regulatory protein PadR